MPTRRRKPDEVEAAKLAAEWNAAYDVGQAVHYSPILGGSKVQRYRTRSEASVLPCGIAVVWLDGKAGCVALSHVEPIDVEPVKRA